MLKLTLLVASYLLGSIPFGFIIVYLAKRSDIRKLGSGNIGATNVARILGSNWGFTVFMLDFLKGFTPPLIALVFLKNSATLWLILVSVAAVCGHNWPVFLKFKGGKGVATSLGAMSALSWIFPRLAIVLILAVFSWLAVFLIFRYVSLASITASLVFFVLTFTFSQPRQIKILSFFLFIFILFRHQRNIKRLLNREEHRFKGDQ